MFTNQCIGYKQTGLGKIDFLNDFLSYINNTSDIFTNLFHYFFSKTFSQFEHLKKETSFLLVQNIFFSVCQMKKKS